MAKKCKYLREGNLCAARSFRMQNIALLAVTTMTGGVARTTRLTHTSNARVTFTSMWSATLRRLLIARSMSRRKEAKSNESGSN